MAAKTYCVSRTVSWAECDPGGIVHTPRYFAIGVEIVEGFFRDVVGVAFADIHRFHKCHLPWVHASSEFHSRMAVGETFEMRLAIERLGATSITYCITGHGADGRDLFRTRLVAVMVDDRSFEPRPLLDWMMFSSSGSTGPPRVFRFSEIDRKYWTWADARSLFSMAIRRGQTAFIVSGYGPHVWAWGVRFALAEMGLPVIPGGGMDAGLRAAIVERFKPTVLTCTPSYSLHPGRVMRALGQDPAKSSIRTVFTGGEPAAGIPVTRAPTTVARRRSRARSPTRCAAVARCGWTPRRWPPVPRPRPNSRPSACATPATRARPDQPSPAACHNPTAAPVGSAMMANQPMPGISVLS